MQIIAANVAIILGLAGLWYAAFMRQSTIYSERLMSTFNIEPGQLHAMYVDDVERQLWTSVLIGLAAATVASIGLAWLLVRPLRSLAGATERLRHGDYGRRSPITRGEVGHLAGNINALAAALEQEENRRAQYMADLSHELRTPITNLRGYTEGLEDGVVQPDAHFFKLMSGELKQLTALTRTIDTLQLNALEDEPEPETLTASEHLNDAVERWASQFANNNLEIELSVVDSAATQTFAVSATSLRHIIDNLLSNMVRYAHTSGRCTVAVTPGKHRGFLRIAFANYAPDVAPDALPYLFDRFYRTSTSRTRAADDHASGLGLSIVKQLSLAAGGHVYAALDAKRLTVSVELPILYRTPERQKNTISDNAQVSQLTDIAS